MFHHRLLRGCCVAASLLLALGCARQDSRSQVLPGYAAIPIERMAVMPFLAGRPDPALQDGQVSPLDCTVETLCLVVNEVPYAAEPVMTQSAHDLLSEKLGDRVVPLARSERVYAGMAREEAVDTPRALAKRLGSLLGADHVVLGTVWRYRERSGAQGASVGFSLFLLEVDTGRRVWRGQFDRTQVPLTEDAGDLFGFLKRGPRWLSAAEYARFGMEEVLATFPETRP